MYQASIAESLLRLGEVARRAGGQGADAIAELARATGGRMVRSLSLCCHPDGGIALLNDCAFGQAPTLEQLHRRFGDTLGAEPDATAGAWHLEQAGYMGWRGASGSYLVFDGGDIGPDYNPGHGHADTLSFELSHRGRRLLTDTGVLSYAQGAARAYDRGTAAHNTLEIDGASQSELWGSFRCARRAKVTRSRVEKQVEPQRVLFRAAYRGPSTGRRQVHHSRTIDVAGSRLSFVDAVDIPGRHEAVCRLHLAPGLRARLDSDAVLLEDESGRALARARFAGGELALGTSPYHPEFGLELERGRIEARARFRDRLELAWAIELL